MKLRRMVFVLFLGLLVLVVGRLSVQAHSAAMPPLGLGAWVERAKLQAADGTAYAQFGYSVALSGDGHIALVGAKTADVNGNEEQGAAYLFRREGDRWVQWTKLVAEDGKAWDNFGNAVALSEDGHTALVAAAAFAPVWWQGHTGAVYVFVYDGSRWVQQAKLRASGGRGGDRFGDALALSADGSTALIGAPYVDAGGRKDRGAVYVFKRQGNTWTEQTGFTLDETMAEDYFGWAVALSADGRVALVGADSTNVNGVENQGAAYVLTAQGDTWTVQARLTASDGGANHYFGNAVALSNDGNLALVGAPEASVGGQECQGAAYVFDVQVPPTPTPTLVPTPSPTPAWSVHLYMPLMTR